ncbi:MAG: 4-hydroxy-3-methylbut-2-enyl diphosphate reductase [Fidelibacterota bacterium]|nr:MAG: 4-hydroxy-3-methylbut-2-enyl diphosphate reductase [Candidatus Neomarinimicrobiota bacterium]
MNRTTKGDMEITVARDAGYCFGVRDAVNMAYEAAQTYGTVYMLGDIVHNEQVVQDLAAAGTIVVNSIDDIPDGAPVLFRAHGTPVELWEQVNAKGIRVIDATCPLVREIHDEVRKISSNGRQVIIIGDHGHDEVIGIASQIANPIIIATPDEARELRKMKRAAVVSQSTQMIENVQAIINILMTKVFDLHFVNTICFPTKRNHEQIKQLATESDVMIVIGSFTSANSKRLTQLALERNPRSYQVTCGTDVDEKWFVEADKVGISAGASTPDYLIEEVKSRIEAIATASHAQVT